MIEVQVLCLTAAIVSIIYGLDPDIQLNGIHLKGGKVYHLNCTTNRGALGCSVEFYANDTTVDDIRFFNGKCVHKDGECLPNKCYCSNECKIFQLNITYTTSNAFSHFGCGARIMVSDSDTNITYFARTAVNQDGEGTYFRMLEKIIIPVSVEKLCNSTVLIPTQENEENHTVINRIFLVCLIVISFVLIVICILWYAKKKSLIQNKKEQVGRPHRSNAVSTISGSSSERSTQRQMVNRKQEYSSNA